MVQLWHNRLILKNIFSNKNDTKTAQQKLFSLFPVFPWMKKVKRKNLRKRRLKKALYMCPVCFQTEKTNECEDRKDCFFSLWDHPWFCMGKRLANRKRKDCVQSVKNDQEEDLNLNHIFLYFSRPIVFEIVSSSLFGRASLLFLPPSFFLYGLSFDSGLPMLRDVVHQMYRAIYKKSLCVQNVPDGRCSTDIEQWHVVGVSFWKPETH